MERHFYLAYLDFHGDLQLLHLFAEYVDTIQIFDRTDSRSPAINVVLAQVLSFAQVYRRTDQLVGRRISCILISAIRAVFGRHKSYLLSGSLG